MAYYPNDRIDVPRLEFYEKQKLDDELTEQRIKTKFQVNNLEQEMKSIEKRIDSTAQIDIREVTEITEGIKKETSLLTEEMRLEIGRNNLRFRKEIDSLRQDVAKAEIKANEIEQKIQKISNDFNRKIESLLKQIGRGRKRAVAYLKQLEGLYDEIRELHPDKLTPGKADIIQNAISDVSSNIDSGSYDAAIGRAQGCIPEAGELKARLILLNDEYFRLCQQIYQLSDSLLKKIDQLKEPAKNVQMIDGASEKFDGRISFWTSALFDETVEYYLSVMKDVSTFEETMDIDGLKQSLSRLKGVSDKLDQCVSIAHAEFLEHDKAVWLICQIYETMIRFWDISNDEAAFGFNNGDKRQSYRMTFLNNSGMSATFIVMPNSHFKLHVRCIDEPQDAIRCNAIFDGVIQDLINNGIPVDDGMQNDSKTTLMAFVQDETKAGERIKYERIQEEKTKLGI